MSSDLVALARDAYEAFNRRDVDAVLERFDPGIRWRMHERFTRVPRVYEGYDGVREVFDLFHEHFDDFRVEPVEFVEAGDHIVVPIVLSGRQKGSGEPVEIEIVHCWTTRERRAVALDAYSTKEEALAAAGG